MRLSPVIADTVLGGCSADLAGAVVSLDDFWGRETTRIRAQLSERPSWNDHFLFRGRATRPLVRGVIADLREQAPTGWRYEEAFSAVAYLTPDEMSRVADTVRRALAPYRDREQRPLARPEGALPVALITRLFPLLPHPEGEADDADGGDSEGDGAAGTRA